MKLNTEYKHAAPPVAKRHRVAGLAAVFATCGMLATSATATNFVVTTAADEPFNGTETTAAPDGAGLSLREAIGLANQNFGAPLSGDIDGDTIAINPILVAIPPTLNLASSITITDDVVIDGTSLGLANYTVTTGGADRIFIVNTAAAAGLQQTVSLSRLILARGAVAGPGGGVHVLPGGSLVLRGDVEITNCRAVDGGGVYNEGSLSVESSRFNRNNASGPSGSGGGIFNAAGASLSIAQSSFSGNVAVRAGGAIEDQAGAGVMTTIDTTTFESNNAGVAPAVAAANPGNGGAIHITGASDMTINRGAAIQNVAAREGGAFWNGTGTMMITGVEIQENTASGPAVDDGGGGVFNNGGTLVIADCQIRGNIANGVAGSGGGIFSTDGSVKISGDTNIAGNIANRAGGGIEMVQGELTLDGVNLGGALDTDGNIAGPAATANPGNGGGLHVSRGGVVNITGGQVIGNVAASEGGGLWNQADTTMTILNGTQISRNTARGAAADNGGGGIFNNNGTLIVDGTDAEVVVSGNVADGTAGSGGGLLTDGGRVEISGAVFTGNTANRAGGGIEGTNLDPDAPLSIKSSRLTDNNAGVAPAVAAPGNGGGLHITGGGVVTLESCRVGGNIAASEGGGLWNGTGSMLVSESEIQENRASGAAADNGGGGIFNAGGIVTLNPGVAINGNSADGAAGSGGGIFNDAGGQVAAESITIAGNTANRAGGGIEDNSGAGVGLDLKGVEFTGNNAGVAPAMASPGNGGAIHISGAGDAVISGGSATQNMAASEGGAFWNGTGMMTISAGTITGNVASGPDADNGGGGIFNDGGTVVVQDGTMISENQADGDSGSGGGIFNNTDGSITISKSMIANNSANRAGGGIEDNAGSSIEIVSSRLTENNTGLAPAVAAPGNGGAIHITGAGNVALSDCTVDNNSAANEGGGLWNSGRGGMRVVSSTVNSNRAPDGGGVFQQAGADGMLAITNSTISGNESTNGGGLQTEGGSTEILNATIASNNASGVGGGINLVAGDVKTTNTAIGDNSAATSPDLNGALSSAQSCLLEDPTGASGITGGVAGNIVGVDPLLAALANNGGTTQTHLPSLSSPLANAGDNTAAAGLTTDQRGSGFPRIEAGTVEIGAVEIDLLTYTEWAEATFSDDVPSDEREPDANPDCDARSNAEEYLTGSDPENGSDGSALSVKIAGTELIISYDRVRAIPPGVDGSEMSTDLASWMSATPDRAVTGLTADLDRITLTLPSTTEPRLFGRLSLTTF